MKKILWMILVAGVSGCGNLELNRDFDDMWGPPMSAEGRFRCEMDPLRFECYYWEGNLRRHRSDV